MKLQRILVALLGLTLAVPQTASAQASTDFKVIVNAANPSAALSRDELSRLFLKKVTTWSNARPVAVVEQKPSAELRDRFARDVHGRQPAYITSYWQQMIFSGRATPPPEKSSDAEITAFVAENAGAIGYVASNTPLPPGVKVLSIGK
jgi:ABC-type phosphate transport system substrate-binding protein